MAKRAHWGSSGFDQMILLSKSWPLCSLRSCYYLLLCLVIWHSSLSVNMVCFFPLLVPHLCSALHLLWCIPFLDAQLSFPVGSYSSSKASLWHFQRSFQYFRRMYQAISGLSQISYNPYSSKLMLAKCCSHKKIGNNKYFSQFKFLMNWLQCQSSFTDPQEPEENTYTAVSGWETM